VKRVAEVMGVSRSQLSERLKGTARPRSTYSKVGDADLLGPLRTWVDERPTYGYRRITALNPIHQILIRVALSTRNRTNLHVSGNRLKAVLGGLHHEYSLASG
jgi:hypothetical protein